MSLKDDATVSQTLDRVDKKVIFETSYNDEHDIAGRVAYSLYKQHKIEHIHQKKLQGTVLTDDDLKNFHDISIADSSIEGYRLRAEIILQSFIDNALQDTMEDLEQQVVNRQAEILKEVIKPLKRKWHEDLLINILASFLFAVLIIAVVFIARYRNISLEDVLKLTLIICSIGSIMFKSQETYSTRTHFEIINTS